MFIGTLTTVCDLLSPGPQIFTFDVAFDPMAVTRTATAATPDAGTPPTPVTLGYTRWLSPL
jgi:hypothetical protein